MNETLECCQVLSRSVHRGPTLNDILLRLAGVKYFTLINAISGYHSLKLNKISSYLTTFSCPFGRYRYIWLAFRVALTGNMIQKKIDEMFCGMPNVFGIADDSLISGSDKQGKDHDKTLDKVLKICSSQTWGLTKICVFSDALTFHSLVKSSPSKA